ncbi:MAG: class I SAM-dependent methyltransferase, partial [Leptolyngbyaceae cyanobacterium]
IDVLDIGCGRGYVLNKLAQPFPNSQFTGYALNEDAIATAIHRAQSQQLHNVHFQVRDTARLEEIETYNLITSFDAMQDQAAPAQLLRNIYNALRPDGVYLMQEIHAASDVSGNLNHPLAPLLYTVSCMHCMTVSPAATAAATTSPTADDLELVTGREKASELLREAGFTDIEIKQLPHDVVNDYYIVCK